MPLSHLTLTVSHLPTSTSFFLSCLQPLGYKFIGRHDDYIGFGQNSDEPADFWITEQKPGFPAGAAHVAFPASSKDAVHSFFISALKAGGKLHGEPKTRDSQSGYFSAAVMDMDGNSIEAVWRPGPDGGSSRSSVARSVVSKPALGLLENGSVVSKASTMKSDAKSYASKAITTVDRSGPSERSGSVISREIQQAPSQTYVVHTHTTQKSDDGQAAKTIVGTLIGAAAGAAIAYAMSKGDSETAETIPTPQYPPTAFRQLPSSPGLSQAPSQIQDYQDYRAIEAAPPPSSYSQANSRPTLTRSVTSKNPWASTVYEGTEYGTRGPKGGVYIEDMARRASEGKIYNESEIPLRAIEYPPPLDAQQYAGDVSTLISSFREKSNISEKGSVYSRSTIKASKTQAQSYHNSHHSVTKSKSHAGSTASSARTAREIPLPESSTASNASSRSGARPSAPYDDVDVDTHVTPDDSISQVGDSSRRSLHSHRSHHSHKSHASHTSRRSSKFDEPVRPSDSVSQVSSNATRVSQRTIKAGGSIAGGGSKVGSRMSSSRRGSQVA